MNLEGKARHRSCHTLSCPDGLVEGKGQLSDALGKEESPKRILNVCFSSY